MLPFQAPAFFVDGWRFFVRKAKDKTTISANLRLASDLENRT
jgi:hypothetical protein